MRFYPTADVDFYVQQTDGWDKHCRYKANKNWKRPNEKLINPNITTIRYWRDIEGAKKPQITIKDLYFKEWHANRLREGACLPLLYAMGERYIRIEKAYPAGFKCSPLPISLAEVQDIKRRLKLQAKMMAKWRKSQASAQNECRTKKQKKTMKCKRLLKNKKGRGRGAKKTK